MHRYWDKFVLTSPNCSPSPTLQTTKINWKDATHNLTKAYPRVLDEDDDLTEPGSFFNFFEVAKDHLDVSRIPPH